MEEAVAKEHYDTANQLGTTTTDLARRSKDSALLKETVARKGTIIKEMAEIQKAQADVAEAIDSLDKNPTDTAANLAVGKFCCFTKNRWEKGILMLALGDDLALKDLALKELKGMTDATEQVKLGDAWWDLGEKKTGLAKKTIQGHAASWYQQALPGLTGLVREKVEKRVAVAAPPSTVVARDQRDTDSPSSGSLKKEGGDRRVGQESIPARQWVELLPRVNLERDRVAGDWAIQGKTVSTTAAILFSRIMLPVKVEGEYDLQVSFSVHQGTAREANVILPVGAHHTLLVMGGFAGGDLYCLDLVDGQFGDFNGTARRVAQLVPEHLYTLSVEVREQGEHATIQASLDGKPLIRWQGKEESLSLRGVNDVPQQRRLGLFAQASFVTFQSAKLRMVSGKASWVDWK